MAGSPPEPSEAGRVGGGGARERVRDARKGVPSRSGLCADEIDEPENNGLYF